MTIVEQLVSAFCMFVVVVDVFLMECHVCAGTDNIGEQCVYSFSSLPFPAFLPYPLPFVVVVVVVIPHNTTRPWYFACALMSEC